MTGPRIVTRSHAAADRERLVAAGIQPVLARVLAARGVTRPEQIHTALAALPSPAPLKDAQTAARLLATVIERGARMVIVADYDADGATACAVVLRAMRAMGADVDYLVPNRFEMGYGLTPEIVALAAARHPAVLVTVDNGIASIEGVAEARARGIDVVVTDHHLPGEALPAAAAIVNPNQPGCGFAGRQLAGVGVAFYVMLALRSELRARGWFATRPEPNLAHLLDIVALGTVADVVRLDDLNRLLVANGLARIRAQRGAPGILALLEVAGRDARRASAYDLGFVAGPRLNAAGRLTDMSLGIECLVTDDAARARELAAELHRLNAERRQIEADMQADALAQLDGIDAQGGYTLTLFDPDWHQGVVGLLAARLRERLHRPVIAFARGADGMLKGSGRSIRALHLRDALDLVAKRRPGCVQRFGGHAAAAGLTLRECDLAEFSAAFESVARALLSPGDLEEIVETDGPLGEQELDLATAQALQACVWGQGFPPPRFTGEFMVDKQRVVGEKHARLVLRTGRRRLDAIAFNQPEPLPGRIRAVYRPEANEWQGNLRLQLVIERWEVG